MDDPACRLPRLAAAAAVDLSALGQSLGAVPVLVGDHRFNLTCRLDRALCRTLIGTVTQPGS